MNRKEIRQIEFWGVCALCGEEFNSERGVISHRASKHKDFTFKDLFSQEDKQDICKKYSNGKSLGFIAKTFDTNASVVIDILKEGGIKIRSIGRKYKDKIRICKYCGEEFIGNTNAKYCSDKCSTLASINPSYFSVFYRDHFRCRYCGKTPADGVRLTIDHVYPKLKGGTNQKINVVTACQECNSHKASRVWPKERIKEIWWQNKKLQEEAEDLKFEEILEEFNNEYPDKSAPILQGGET